MTALATCQSCGASLDPAATICRKCGTPLPDAPTVPSGEFGIRSSDEAIGALALELRDAIAPGLQLLQELGRGGMGVVFLGRDPALRRLVVIKVLLPEVAHDPSARARFAREAEAAAAVSHPNVVSIFQVGTLPESGTAYFVMQYVEGPTVQRAFPAGVIAPLPQVERLIGEVASALAAAHAHNLIHRDIKPSNIMVEADTGRAVVLDFGISAARGARAAAAGEKLTAEGTSIGTPEYMSPEQGAGETVTEKSDVYSLGVVAFELLAGRLPFIERSPMALVAAHIKQPPPKIASLRPDLDPHIASLIDRCLEKDAHRRPPASDIAKLLRPAAGAIIEWPPPGLVPLHRSGARLVSTLNVMTASALGFMLLLLRQPILLSPLRLDAWFRTSGTEDPTRAFDGVPLWFFALALLSFATVALLPVLLARAWILALRLSGGRHSGYPWPVLLDVAWDSRSGTSALINGTGGFALLTPAGRERLIRLRRIRSVVAAIIPVLVVLALVTWVVGWSGGWATGSEILPLQEAVVLFGPVVLCLFAIAGVSEPERRLVARTSVRRLFEEWREPPAVRPELLRAWLTSTGKVVSVRRSNAILSMASFGAFLLTLPLIAAGSVVFFAAAIAASNFAASKADAVALLGSLTTDSLRPTRWQEYDSLFAVSARLPRVTTSADLDAARRLAGWSPLFRAIRPGHLNIDSAVATWSPFFRATIPGYLNVDTTGRPAADTLPMSQAGYGFIYDSAPIAGVPLDRLASDTLTPVLALFRRMARSAPLPPLWFARDSLPGLESPIQLLWSWPFWGGDVRFRNMSAAVLALRFGDSATALLRARENIAVARQRVRSPLFADHLDGLAVLGRDAQLIRRIGEVTNDPALKAEAERLRVLVLRAKADFAPWWRGGAQLLLADPRNPVLLRYLGDTTLSPAARAQAASAAVTAFCFNTREILFGPDPRRRDLLTRIAAALKAVPRMDDMVLAQRRELEGWIRDPRRTNQRYLDAMAEVKLARWQGPQILEPLTHIDVGIKDRLLFCLWINRRLGNIIQ